MDIFIEVCQISTQYYMYSVCVDRDQLRLEQLRFSFIIIFETILNLIVI